MSTELGSDEDRAKRIAKVREEERERNKERLKQVKKAIRDNFIIDMEKPNRIGGQQAGIPTYPFVVKSEDLEIEIKVKHFRSNYQNRDLAILLMELAMDELIR